MKKINLMLLGIFATVLTLFSLGFALADSCFDGGGNYSGYGGMMGWAWPGMWAMWLFGLVFSIAVLIALVLLIIWLIKHINKK